ncbi:hypothetical protein PPSIR1_38354 [Plesiocystis pacifica SIR-1]|uniref:Uncharacterized protein n=1 Tax=Plesiocystis pacifica SIR-1 TaxID=391625 RepID=A6G8J4_9BACT|nr:hypothetical protein PPSIR1_38354 [Plesiocystis pacifica SIR-1]
MATHHLAPILAPFLEQAERRAVVQALRAHPSWTLGQLLEHIEAEGRYATVLRDLRLGEFVLADPVVVIRRRPPERHPVNHANAERLEAAMVAAGSEFDTFVREVLEEARAGVHAEHSRDGWVDSALLRSFVGGPRWKLQASLARLTEADVIERVGRTNSTRYRLRQGGRAQ